MDGDFMTAPLTLLLSAASFILLLAGAPVRAWSVPRPAAALE
jgi:hypothetical protein